MRTAAEASGTGSFSADLSAHGSRTRRAAVAVASSQTGAHAHAVKNQLQALNQGVQRKWKLWSKEGRKQLELLRLLPWANRRRAELLQLLDQLESSIGELDRAVAEQVQAPLSSRRLMTHPGVRPVTALAFTLTMGPAEL